MISIYGQLVCSNCEVASPLTGDYIANSILAIDLGWITLAEDCDGDVSLYHFCPKCHDAAKAWSRQAGGQESCEQHSGCN